VVVVVVVVVVVAVVVVVVVVDVVVVELVTVTDDDEDVSDVVVEDVDSELDVESIVIVKATEGVDIAVVDGDVDVVCSLLLVGSVVSCVKIDSVFSNIVDDAVIKVTFLVLSYD
jgi:hypothetical protein